MEMEPKVAVLLLAGSGATYLAYRHPAFGAALLVGTGVAMLLHLLIGAGSSRPPER